MYQSEREAMARQGGYRLYRNMAAALAKLHILHCLRQTGVLPLRFHRTRTAAAVGPLNFEASYRLPTSGCCETVRLG
jgi:hypothetical protein